MSQEVLRGGDGSAAANKLRGLRKANRTSVVTDMLADESAAPEEVVSAPAMAPVRLQPAAPEPMPTPELAVEPAPVAPVVEAPKGEFVEPVKTRIVPPAVPAEDPKIKTGIFQTKAEHARLRATFSATRHLTGYRTMSEYVEAAISQMNTRVEEEFNGGEPYPTGLNQVSPGRPLKF